MFAAPIVFMALPAFRHDVAVVIFVSVTVAAGNPAVATR